MRPYFEVHVAMQVYLTLDDKAMRELNKLCEELEAVRKRAMAAEDAGGRSAKADMQKATNEAYLRTAELKARSGARRQHSRYNPAADLL